MRRGILPAALVRLLVVSTVIRRRGFRPAWDRFGVAPIAEVRPSTQREVMELVWAVQAASRRFGLTCLPRSLALCSLLRERGRAAEPRIGVRREAGQLLAHAWVELDGEVLGETLHPEWRVLPLEEAAASLKKAAAPTS